MVRHIVLWSLKDRCFGPDLPIIKTDIKDGLESLNGTIDGLIKIEVFTDCMSSSNADIMLESTFSDEMSLKEFLLNANYTKVSNSAVIPFVETMTAVDFEV